MNKLMTGVLALGLAASLAACSSSTSPTATPSVAPSSPSTTTTSNAPTGAGTTPAADGAIDQTTPEAAMTAFVNALINGKTADICSLTALDGKIVADVQGASEQCTKSFGSLAGSLKSAGSLFEGLTVTGATVNGDKATFDKATTKPELAAQLIKPLAAVKIGSKWYVTTP